MKEKKVMERKNTSIRKLIAGLIFIASLFLAAAVLVLSNGEKNDVIFVALAGGVMLVAAYFFMETLFEEKAEAWKNLYEEMEAEVMQEEETVTAEPEDKSADTL